MPVLEIMLEVFYSRLLLLRLNGISTGYTN